MNYKSHETAVWKGIFAVRFLLIISLALAPRASSQVQQKEQPKLDDLAVAGAKFGVTFYKGLAASYKAGEAERAYKTAVGNSLLDSDLTTLADAYKTKKEEARATATFGHSAGSVFISGAVVVGLMSGVGTVPTALFAAGANYANKQVAIGLGEAGDARAMGFLKEATQKWQTSNGITYESVRRKLRSGDADGAIRDFDKATGMLTDLRNQFPGDKAAADVAQNMVLETMKTEEEATISQTSANTTAIEDLANHVQVTTRLVATTKEALQHYSDRLNETDEALNDASQHIQALEQSQAVTSQQVGAIEDVLYEQQSPAVKIHLLENNYKPGLTADQRSQLITYFKAEQQTEQLIADSAQVVNVAQEVQGILSNLGIRDPTINKAVQIGSVAQKALSAALTGNYLGAVLSVTSLFGSQSDPEAEHFAAIMGYLQQLDKKLDEVLQLQVKTLEAVEKLSNQVAEMDKRLNQRLDRVDFEVKVISENLKSQMWTPYLSCNNAWQDRTLGGAVQFDDSSFTFTTIEDATKFAGQDEKKALECAQKLDDLFLSIKASQVFGPLLSLKTAVKTDFSILPSEQGSALERTDLERFLNDLYQPTIELVGGAWDPGWGSPALLLAALGDPAPNLDSLTKKIDALEKAKSDKKPFNACSEPTVLSVRLRALLCADTRYIQSDIPHTLSASNERMAAQRAAAFMSDPLVRDQLPYLAEWTGLVARPYDLWTGNGSATYTQDEILAGRGNPRGKDVIWSLLSVLDVAIAQQSLLDGDVTAKVVYDLAWNKKAHHPIDPPVNPNPATPVQNAEQISAIKLLSNVNNPWLGKNVLLMALRDSLYSKDTGGDASIPYQEAFEILSSVEDIGLQVDTSQGPVSEEVKKVQQEKKERSEASNFEKVQEATFALRGIFDLPDTVKCVVEDSDDGFGGRVRKFFYESGSYKLELPSPDEFANGQLSYPPSLVALLKLRETMTDRYIDYQMISEISDPEKQKRVAALLFSGLASPKEWDGH